MNGGNYMTTTTVNFTQKNICKTYYCALHIAGDYNTAIKATREYTYRTGACFQLYEAKYVYTGGLEDGIVARAIVYPRFDKNSSTILQEVMEYSKFLANELCQKSYTIETSDNTYYFESTNELHKK